MEKYNEFDTASTVALSDVVIKGFRFTRRELFLAVTTLICILVIIILAALLGAAKRDNDRAAADKQALAGNATSDGLHGNRTSGGGGGGVTPHASMPPPTAGPPSTRPPPHVTGGPPPHNSSRPPCPEVKDDSCYTPACFRAAGHVLELLNHTATSPPSLSDACQDFYSFACGNFPRVHPLQPDQTETTTFLIMYDQNLRKLRRVVEAVSSTEDPNHYEAKVKSFYLSCLDHFERTGLKGTPFLDKVVDPAGGWWVLTGDSGWPPSGYSFQDQLQKVHVDFWVDAFFTFSVGPDWLDWNKATIEIYLSGLGLHYSEYDSTAMLAPYKAYMRAIASMLIRDANITLTEDDKMLRLDKFVDDAITVEKEMAKLKKSSSYETDPHSLDRRPTLSALNQNSSGQVDWVSLFKYMFNTHSHVLVTENTHVVVYEQEYIQKLTIWLSRLDPSKKSRMLNNYMMWRLASAYSRYLSWDYLHAYYTWKEEYEGSLERPQAWYSCLSWLDRAMPDAMGALFVKDHFVDKDKEAAHNMTHYLKAALTDSLSSRLHWMSPATRQIARQKIKDSLIKLGYPKYMMDKATLNSFYTTLTIDESDYFSNILSITDLFREGWIRYLSTPNDRSVWVYPTYSTNLEYYNPWKELLVPAGAMQFPVFDHQNPRYMNFGAMGSILARELTHAVDVFGSEYMLNGSHYGEWWSLNTTRSYLAVQRCMINAYREYSMGPYPGFEFLGPSAVPQEYVPYALSESSGIKLAYKGYQKWLNDTGGENTMPGHLYTNDQLFFISYAQSMCANRDTTEIALDVFFGYHVTNKIRVNGALAQVQEFQDAFNCRAPSPMVAAQRCSLY
ncbi:endothelin-converting enzyme homolog [Babylonia areolata]|uniref:endothelin-converting enzyme homolog n=1 Tax=Babylonia areolata TaxID=304850 RepID=UPI003FD5597A